MGHIPDGPAEADGDPYPVGQPDLHHMGHIKGTDSPLFLPVHIHDAAIHAPVNGDVMAVLSDGSEAAHSKIHNQKNTGKNRTHDAYSDGKQVAVVIVDLRPGRDDEACLVDDHFFGRFPQTGKQNEQRQKNKRQTAGDQPPCSDFCRKFSFEICLHSA